jgi:hypothetical protein
MQMRFGSPGERGWMLIDGRLGGSGDVSLSAYAECCSMQMWAGVSLRVRRVSAWWRVFGPVSLTFLSWSSAGPASVTVL